MISYAQKKKRQGEKGRRKVKNSFHKIETKIREREGLTK